MRIVTIAFPWTSIQMKDTNALTLGGEKRKRSHSVADACTCLLHLLNGWITRAACSVTRFLAEDSHGVIGTREDSVFNLCATPSVATANATRACIAPLIYGLGHAAGSSTIYRART